MARVARACLKRDPDSALWAEVRGYPWAHVARRNRLSTMRYLLETSFLVSLLCGDRTAADAVRRLEPQGLAMAMVSLAELYFAAFMSANPARSREAVDRLHQRLTILPLDPDTCHILGAEAARLAGAAVALPPAELAIAATCLRHGLTLVTPDPRRYEQIAGLKLLVPET